MKSETGQGWEQRTNLPEPCKPLYCHSSHIHICAPQDTTHTQFSVNYDPELYKPVVLPAIVRASYLCIFQQLELVIEILYDYGSGLKSVKCK